MIFERALGHILKAEGGFVDHPNDRGGPTNFGITLKTLSDYRAKQVTVEDLRQLTSGEAGLIYRRDYWDANALFLLHGERIPIIVFDQLVNRGGVAAIRLLQKVLNNIFKCGLKYDGELGPMTASAANHVNDESELAVYLIREAQRSYIKATVSDPTQLIFLEGWMNRTFNLFDLIFSTGAIIR